MSRVYLSLVNNEWKVSEKSSFWIDSILLEKLRNLKKIQADKWDGLIIIDGPERSGKSILGMICGWFLSNGKLTEKNYARGLDDVANKIAELEDGSVLVLDEASTIFNSKEGTSKTQRKLIKILDVVGQKNLIFILCLPCFFDLNKTIAVRRSKFLLHVYPDKNYKRGQFVMWGERSKPKLYKFGKKDYDSYAYPKPDTSPGEYFEFHPPFYDEYINKIKFESLKQVLEDATEVKKKEITLMGFKRKIIGRIHEMFPELTHQKIADIFEVDRKTITSTIQEYKIGKESGFYIGIEDSLKKMAEKYPNRRRNKEILLEKEVVVVGEGEQPQQQEQNSL